MPGEENAQTSAPPVPVGNSLACHLTWCPWPCTWLWWQPQLRTSSLCSCPGYVACARAWVWVFPDSWPGFLITCILVSACTLSAPAWSALPGFLPYFYLGPWTNWPTSHQPFWPFIPVCRSSCSWLDLSSPRLLSTKKLSSLTCSDWSHTFANWAQCMN